MQDILRIDNYIIETPILEILNRIKAEITNGKLRDINAKDDDIAVTCPVHNDGLERNPDCHINLGKNSKLEYGYFHCFACDASGPFYKFVAACFDTTDEWAKKWLISNYGILSGEKIILDDDIVFGKPKPKKQTINKSILDQYQSWCPYLAKRKLSRATCEKFNVKYDPKTRQVIFPAYDMYGRLVMLPERAIDYKMFYLNENQEKPVYCLDYIMKNNIKKAIITEGPFDCLTAYEYGWPAIATLGNISDEQIEQINKSCISTLYLMFDNDIAGQKFATRLKNSLNPRIITEVINIPSPYKDINDLSKEIFDEIMQKYTK